MDCKCEEIFAIKSNPGHDHLAKLDVSPKWEEPVLYSIQSEEIVSDPIYIIAAPFQHSKPQAGFKSDRFHPPAFA